MLAERAPRNEAGTLQIQMHIGKALLGATIPTLSFCGRNVHCEYHAQFTCGSITVKIVHRCIHFRSPVAPKRSALILDRSWPAAINRSVAYSTNDVGPQTQLLGRRSGDDAPLLINSASMRPAGRGQSLGVTRVYA